MMSASKTRMTTATTATTATTDGEGASRIMGPMRRTIGEKVAPTEQHTRWSYYGYGPVTRTWAAPPLRP